MSENLFDNYEDVNKFNYFFELKRVRSRLITIAAIFFIADLFSLLISNTLTVQLLLFSLVIPIILGLLALLAFREPMGAMIIASIVIAGIWTYLIIMFGARGIITGFIVKAMVIYLLISGFQSARTAQRLKKELGNAV